MTCLALPAAAHAQYVAPNKRNATSAELIGGNMLIGGFTAATHALIAGKDPFRAFAIGSLGGAVILGGKYLTVEPGTGLLGLALTGAGISTVSNAGRGISPWDEMTIPLPGLRFRFAHAAESKVRVSVNVYETVLVAQHVFHPGVNVDWGASAASGALVLRTDQRQVELDGTAVNGAASGPVAIVSAFSNDPDLTTRHEIVHVYQAWFEQEAWGRPIEDYVRSELPGGRRIPSWIELGVGAPLLIMMEHAAIGRRGTHLLKEAEAGQLARR